MREVFQQELREVQERLVEISGLVAVSIENATRAFNESNVSLAETVIADDNKIDELTVNLDELAINILARQQPVARDLRIVVSALRISASLERMGDMAEHIAQLARYRYPEKVVPKGLRSTFKERIPDHWWRGFFPRSHAVEEAMFPSTDEARALFEAAGFSTLEVVRQEIPFEGDMGEAVAKLKLRAVSVFEHMSDQELDEGFALIDAALAAGTIERKSTFGDFVVFERG